MADNNKVEFGISNLLIGTYTDNNGVVTLGTAEAQPGAVSLSLSPESENSDFYADNILYYSGVNDSGFSGTLEVARFDTKIKEDFFAYAETADGGFAAIKGATKSPVFLAFQCEGDAESRRCIIYNVILGGINREFNTIEATKEPVTETCDITVVGDNTTGITIASYRPADTGYATLFSNPPAPALKP